MISSILLTSSIEPVSQSLEAIWRALHLRQQIGWRIGGDRAAFHHRRHRRVRRQVFRQHLVHRGVAATRVGHLRDAALCIHRLLFSRDETRTPWERRVLMVLFPHSSMLPSFSRPARGIVLAELCDATPASALTASTTALVQRFGADGSRDRRGRAHRRACDCGDQQPDQWFRPFARRGTHRVNFGPRHRERFYLTQRRRNPDT